MSNAKPKAAMAQINHCKGVRRFEVGMLVVGTNGDTPGVSRA